MRVKIYATTIPLAERPTLFVEAASTVDALRMVLTDPKLLDQAYGDRRREPGSLVMLSAQPADSHIATRDEMEARERKHQQDRGKQQRKAA